LHWNIATADRNIANFFKGFAQRVFQICKANEEIPIFHELGSQKRNASRTLPVRELAL
jgi:hypothetical protein